MKTKKLFFLLLFLLCLGIWVTPQRVSAQGASVNFQVFYDDLSPYGTWVNNPEYGYVWVPNVAPGFTPYSTNGYWVYTDEGWTWVSNYPWGWAPFHYGRWYTDQSYGPIWVPDNEWGPGWVTWRRSGDYYGWAPIGPGVSNNVAYSNAYNPPSNQWTFVRNNDFGRRDLNNYYVKPSNNVAIIKGSTVIKDTRINKQRTASYNGGPAKAEVEKLGGRPVNAVAIKESSKPGQSLSNNQLQIYRPQVQKTSSNGHKPAPSKVSSLKNVKPPAQRTGATSSQKVNQPAKQQTPPQHTVQPAKQQRTPTQRTVQPAKQQTQPARQQQQHTVQPAKQQTTPQRTVQPAKQQQQRTVQPPKQQQQQQQQRNAQPPKQQEQQQQQRNAQPPKQQQQQQQQRNAQPPRQQQSQPQHENPPQTKEENPPH
jgi:DNA segregation ATPase FtsK/SpoIIIE-like protein